MAIELPRTLPEWRSYVHARSADELFERAADANRAHFVRGLLEEGYSAAEVEAIFVLLARRLKARGRRPPVDGWYDLVALATLDS